MKNNLLERYKNGEERVVWSEIIASKSDIPEDTIELVLDEMMSRFLSNLQLIKIALENFGYVFTGFDYGQPVGVKYGIPFLEVQEKSKSRINEVISEFEEHGKFPLVFLKFIEFIHNIDFIGYFPSWKNPALLLDSSLFFPIDLIIPLNSNDIHQDNMGQNVIIFSFDEFTKENISGGVGYGIYLTEKQHIDSTVAFYGKTPLSFVEYLRLTLKWIGFPNLELAKEGEIPENILEFILETRSKLASI